MVPGRAAFQALETTDSRLLSRFLHHLGVAALGGTSRGFFKEMGMAVTSKWGLRAMGLMLLAAPMLALAQDATDLQFVPEPETLALLGVAGVALVVARWMRRK
jgi:hypothetical protein